MTDQGYSPQASQATKWLKLGRAETMTNTMSFTVWEDVNCPNENCHPFTAELWRVVNAKQDPLLKERALGGEINMIVCPLCQTIFYADRLIIYHDPDRELLAFVYPEKQRSEEASLQLKIREDLQKAREAEEDAPALSYEPVLLFGLAALAELAEADQWLKDEEDVMEAVAAELKLKIHRLSPHWARQKGIPSVLPKTDADNLKNSVMAGMQQVLAANDRLESYQKLLNRLHTETDLL